ncbi:uncharacterized protein LOC6583651 [Drosophila mojavensis]|uniref:INO80 complex subunit F domain-containing protein n=1 Tax=Drosophila mojavensis TaxID=7230 RepID=B4KY73_DROMO|nr:uncharacterized protein LOC6583651 [Drosophila mojavensis]EDW19792.1 uncharacterized protein Dmoj_GI13966 [Drosophila mojavensis]
MTLNKKYETYKNLTEKIYTKCLQIQTENERSIMRVNEIKKLLRRRTYDVMLLKNKLDKHGDNWRSIPMMVPQPKGKPEQKRRGPKPKSKHVVSNAAAEVKDPTPRKPRKQRMKPQSNNLQIRTQLSIATA